MRGHSPGGSGSVGIILRNRYSQGAALLWSTSGNCVQNLSLRKRKDRSDRSGRTAERCASVLYAPRRGNAVTRRRSAGTVAGQRKHFDLRSGKNPAKISVSRGDEKWNLTDQELNKLPDDVRPFVERMLGGGPMSINLQNTTTNEAWQRWVRTPQIRIDGQATPMFQPQT